MKDSLSPPSTCFHTQQAEEAPFHAVAMHLKCPVAEHIHSRRSAVCAFDSWNAVLDFLTQLRVKMHQTLSQFIFQLLQTCRIRVALYSCASRPYKAQ